MKFESFIARRYLISKHKINFISIISFISIAGITIGVAALIIVLSVFNGFGSLVTSYLKNFDPDIRLESISPESSAKTGELAGIIGGIPEIKNYSPFVNGKVLAYRGGLREVVNLKGINEDAGRILYNIPQNILYGRFDLSAENSLPKIIIGLRLADELQALAGDTITLISPAGIEKSITQLTLPSSGKFILSGIFNSNNNEYDAFYIFSELMPAQKLLGYGNTIQGYEIKLSDPATSDKVKEKLENSIDKKLFAVNTWYDFHKDLYTVMQIERWSAYIILSLIIAVATFNILGSLSMSVIEKKRDIGILVSMGAMEKSILKIFMFEGVLIGITGTLAGVIIGYFICYLQLEYNIYPLDPTQYKIDSLPLEVRISDFFFITGISMLLSFLASLFPAKRAAKINPVEAIKWE